MTARDRLVVLALVIAALLAGGWFLAIAPARERAGELAGQIAEQEAARDAAQTDVAAGAAARGSYTADYATVARLGAAVPDDDNVASLLVQLRATADASGVDFRTIRTAQQSGAGAGAAATTPVAASQLTAATLPPGAAVGAAGFPTMPFSFAFDGSFFQLTDFVGRVQRFLTVDDRALTVRGRFVALDGIALRSSPRGFPQVRAALAATTYLLPPSQGLTAGASPQGPAGAGAVPASDPAGGAAVPGAATATPPGVR